MAKNNNLVELQNKLFEAMEWLQDREVEGDKLDEEIKRQLAFNELAKTAVANAALILKCTNDLTGLPASDELPLIPPSPSDNPKYLTGKRDGFIDGPGRHK